MKSGEAKNANLASMKRFFLFCFYSIAYKYLCYTLISKIGEFCEYKNSLSSSRWVYNCLGYIRSTVLAKNEATLVFYFAATILLWVLL